MIGFSVTFIPTSYRTVTFRTRILYYNVDLNVKLGYCDMNQLTADDYILLLSLLTDEQLLLISVLVGLDSHAEQQ